MTAINILALQGGAMLFTDAIVSVNGEINWIGSKVVRYPHLSAAVAVTGKTQLATAIVQDYIGGASISFDDMVSTMVEAVSKGLDAFRHEFEKYGDHAFDIYTVGLSHKTNRYEVYCCSYQPGETPTLTRATPLIIAPGDERLMAMLDQADIIPSLILEMGLDRQRDTMAEIMRIQRRYARERGEAIGGFQELTILSAAGAHSMILDVWADRVGERISA